VNGCCSKVVVVTNNTVAKTLRYAVIIIALIGVCAYSGFVFHHIKAAKAAFANASVIQLRFSTGGQGPRQIHEIEITDTNKIGKLATAVFRTAHIGVLLSPLRSRGAFGTRLWMHFEGFSSQTKIVKVSLIALDLVIVNDTWEWRTDGSALRDEILKVVNE